LDLIDEIDGMGAYAASPALQGPRAGAGAPGPLAEHPAYGRRATYGRAVVAGINRGYFRRSIAEASYRYSEECEAKDRIIVGVNAYTDSSEQRPIDILQIPHQVEIDQCERLAAFKKRRDGAKVRLALDHIRAACQKRGYDLLHDLPVGRAGSPVAAAGLDASNVMPALVDGALAGCTLGEMVQAMADIYGRYTGGPEW
jgi:methylmalonyl-CoA mutase N-terminal domain/subunit